MKSTQHEAQNAAALTRRAFLPSLGEARLLLLRALERRARSAGPLFSAALMSLAAPALGEVGVERWARAWFAWQRWSATRF